MLKAYGFYQLTPEWRFGSTLIAQSGRPKSCLGYNPDGSDFFYNYLDYGRYYHYCDGKAVPRGSKGNLPTDITLGLNVGYVPRWAPGLDIQLDVLNVFDKQVAQNVEERGELGGQGVVSDQPLSGHQLRCTAFVPPDRALRLLAVKKDGLKRAGLLRSFYLPNLGRRFWRPIFLPGIRTGRRA